jgi:thiol-disulfide isomerase/thioredoxin
VNRPLAGLFLPALLLAAGCTSPDAGPAERDAAAGPFADCAALTAPPASVTSPALVRSPTPAASGTRAVPVTRAAPDPSGTPAGAAVVGAAAAPDGSGQSLPDVDLPCFTGGGQVSFDAVRGPAVVNLWASWCAPCRRELPAFQRLAQRTGGTLHVIGVDTTDDREAAGSLAADLGLTFPTLFDQPGTLRLRLERAGLPVTLFVDGQGRIRHLDNSGALDDTSLTDLVERNLSVAVSR